MRVCIGPEYDGRTLKDWLYQNRFSRGLITRLKKLPDGITVNGEHATVRRILQAGDTLDLLLDDLPDEENEHLLPTEMPLDILYEDHDIIAVNKPPNLATHPSIGHFTDTLANGLAWYFANQGVPFVFRAINRLDRDTSGIVLAAKNRRAAAEMTELMQSGCIRKSYLAVLNGTPDPRSGQIETGIRRKDASIICREVCAPDAPGAKSALTVYRTLDANDGVSLVRAEPVTGRTHQLRVHFASIGTPIAGDGIYGTAETTVSAADRAMNRQALHAAGLIIRRKEGDLVLEAPLPADIQALCDQFHLKVTGTSHEQN